MTSTDAIYDILKKNDFKVSTDTRKDLSGSVFFGIKGDSFDGNLFVQGAIQKGAVAGVTDDPKNSGDNIYIVDDVLKTLQEVARKYRKEFQISIVVIGGSNGKTTSKDLVRDTLKIKYAVHATDGSLNNHLGVPLSLLSMSKNTNIAVFEIGANHPGEHTALLNIIEPTHVAVTNNGMDHLEGFGTPDGSRKANKEIYEWALAHRATVFVNKTSRDLMEDSQENIRILYPEKKLETEKSATVTVILNEQKYATQLVGNYNLANIELALAIGKQFDVDTHDSLTAICNYTPLLKRSQFVTKNWVDFIVDCYNANPTSMTLSLESFLSSTTGKRGVVLGDMLELGAYTESEHQKIVAYVQNQRLDFIVFVGPYFKKALEGSAIRHMWFLDSETASKWFWTQNFTGFTFLLKGSRGMKIEKIYENTP